MFWAILLTFVVTALGMTVIFLYDASRKEAACKRSLQKEMDGLRHRIKDFENREQDRRERSAYDRGVYDARGTDALYRQVLKKYSSRDHADIMMNGEPEEV